MYRVHSKGLKATAINRRNTMPDFPWGRVFNLYWTMYLPSSSHGVLILPSIYLNFRCFLLAAVPSAVIGGNTAVAHDSARSIPMIMYRVPFTRPRVVSCPLWPGLKGGRCWTKNQTYHPPSVAQHHLILSAFSLGTRISSFGFIHGKSVS